MGEREQRMLDESVVGVGWEELGDLRGFKTKDELAAAYHRVYPDAERARASNHVGQLWSFAARIKKGDLVVVPLKTQSAIAIGEIASDYIFSNDFGPDMRHVRSVVWSKTDLPRAAFDQDVLYSFGAFMTVCQVTRNNAEARVRAFLQGKERPGDADAPGEEATNIEEAAHDQILKFVGQKFHGHELARLVEAILVAQGMTTRRSTPGPDGGVDVVAGSGPMGLDSPRMCVQVKSSSSPIGVDVLRALKGTIASYNADQGLLVSGGGFSRETLREAATSFFSVRLWDPGALLETILKHYNRLPDGIRAELPLKQIWALVLEED